MSQKMSLGEYKKVAKAGDVIKFYNRQGDFISEGIFNEVREDRVWYIRTNGDLDWWGEDNKSVEINNSKNSFMTNIIEKFKLLTKGEPDRSAVKAGVRTIDDKFTTDGQTLFIEFLYQKNKADFDTEVIQNLLKDKEEVK